MVSSPTVRFLDRTTAPHIVTLVLLAGLSAMNLTVFLPSLPGMTAYFQTDYALMQLSVQLYLGATAVQQLMIGPLSDRFGRRPLILWALGLFLVATAGCLVAPTIEIFLAFRLLQSAVTVGMVLSRAIVRDMYPQEQAAAQIGYVTMGMAMVPMVAPSIGGGLDMLFGWQAVFVMLFLFGLLVFWLSWRDLGETAVSSGMTFRDQMRDMPELFASRRFWGYALATAFASGCFFAFLGGAPYAASEIYGLNSFWTGVGFAAPATGYATGNFLSGRLLSRFGLNRMMLFGALITFVPLTFGALLTFLGFDGALIFYAFCTFIGLGNGLIIPSAMAGLLSVRPALAGTASGLGGAVMIGGGAALSFIAGLLLEGSNTAFPLQALMVVTSALCLVAILYVIRRERTVAVGA